MLSTACNPLDSLCHRPGCTVAVDSEGMCTITSSVVLPNGSERVVAMAGQLGETAGGVATLEKAGGSDGPIRLLLSEVSAARTLLVREVNTTSGEEVLSSSITLIGAGSGGGGEGDAPLELLQTAHELKGGGGVSGVQMWRMQPIEAGGRDGRGEIVHDEEAFMYSGSEL